MGLVNSIKDVWAFFRFNWRIIALCALVSVIVAGIMRYDRNRGRFVHSGVADYLLDTRTGQYCDPWPSNSNSPDADVPRCADLAKSWR